MGIILLLILKKKCTVLYTQGGTEKLDWETSTETPVHNWALTGRVLECPGRSTEVTGVKLT